MSNLAFTPIRISAKDEEKSFSIQRSGNNGLIKLLVL